MVLDEACATDTYGDDAASDAAMQALERTNCYRTLMGLNRASLDAQLDQAAQAHADYMNANGLCHQESTAASGYTGEWHYDRATAAGYNWNNAALMEVVAWGLGPQEAVDSWMESVYHRVPFTVAEWRDAGFGQAGQYASMTIASEIPAVDDQAIIYPVHGQLEVPVSFDSDTELPDPVPDRGLVGYPVAVTVAASSLNQGAGSNPYEIAVEGASFAGPSGPLDYLLLSPEDDETLWFTVALVPLEPLENDTTYEAEISVSWRGGQFETLSSVFTTEAHP